MAYATVVATVPRYMAAAMLTQDAWLSAGSTGTRRSAMAETATARHRRYQAGPYDQRENRDARRSFDQHVSYGPTECPGESEAKTPSGEVRPDGQPDGDETDGRDDHAQCLPRRWQITEEERCEEHGEERLRLLGDGRQPGRQSMNSSRNCPVNSVRPIRMMEDHERLGRGTNNAGTHAIRNRIIVKSGAEKLARPNLIATNDRPQMTDVNAASAASPLIDRGGNLSWRCWASRVEAQSHKHPAGRRPLRRRDWWETPPRCRLPPEAKLYPAME
jgi:hypothetical protein